MIMATYKELLNELNKGVVRQFYIFAGDEEFLKEEALTRIKKLLIKPGWESFNYYTNTGEEILESGIGTLLNICNTVPFFSNKRLVVIRRADKLCKMEDIVEYAGKPVLSTCLILFVQKTEETLKKFEIMFQHPLQRDLRAWIINKIRDAGKRITEKAMDILKEEAGYDMGILSMEIEKLILFTGSKHLIEENDVRSSVSHRGMLNIWKLVDAVVERKRNVALEAVRELFLEGETGRIIPEIIKQFRFISQAKEMSELGYAQAQIPDAIGFKPDWKKGRFMEQCRRFTPQEIEKNLHHLINTELEIKTGRMPSPDKNPIAVEILVGRLCGEKSMHLP